MATGRHGVFEPIDGPKNLALAAAYLTYLLRDSAGAGPPREEYSQVRLHSAIGYITPADKLHGLAQVIHDERDRKLEEARARRQQERRAGRAVA